ncbi:SHOCT domain-containing protein [Haladaptatus sp. DFWS20]|uniref:SHOCT domain-containing protein n=1 Tax=Haladaptatus sp. DFWS20 TaxID=3403467 RepID=UPI003EBF2ED4
MQNTIRTRSTRSLGIIVVGALTLAVVGGMGLTHAAVPDAMMWDWHDGMWDDGHMAGWGLWGWTMMLFGLLWMALIIGLPVSPVYLVYRVATRSGHGSSDGDPALEVLREQYARGEIDDDEFERRQARLAK